MSSFPLASSIAMASIPATPFQQHAKQSMILPLQSRKRPRTETTCSNMPPPMSPPSFHPAAPDYDLRTALESMPKSLLIDNLLRLNSSHPSIAVWARSYHHILVQEERRKSPKFDHVPKKLWEIINSRQSRVSGSKGFQLKDEVCGSIICEVNALAEKVKAISTWETKLSAMETLLKITNVVLGGEGVLGREVREEFGHEICIELAFLKVVHSMTDEERARMCGIDDGTGLFCDRLAVVIGRCNDDGIMKNMDDVVFLLLDSVQKEEEPDDDDDVETAIGTVKLLASAT